MSNRKRGKRGRREHLTGVKRDFVDSRASAYTEALDSNKVGEFYNFITREFIAKFGDDLDVTKEPSDQGIQTDEDGEDSRQEARGNIEQEQGEGSPSMTQEQAVRASANFGKIREVS